MTTQTQLKTAKKEVEKVLRRYQADWFDVAPDMDDMIWKQTAPAARKARKSLFRKVYPSLYTHVVRKK